MTWRKSTHGEEGRKMLLPPLMTLPTPALKHESDAHAKKARQRYLVCERLLAGVFGGPKLKKRGRVTQLDRAQLVR
jgi:hypothetical protein